MEIRKLDTNKRSDVRDFIQCPYSIYRESTQWVPPIWPEMQQVMNRRKHPYYEHSTAEFFVAGSGKELLGRIAVLENRNYNRHHGRRDGFFYYFDSVNDQSVANALFDAAFDWARQRGLEQVIGPKGFLQGDGMGMLLEGYEHRPAVGVPYNHAYYIDLTVAAGFEKETDFFSGYLSGDHQLADRFFAVAEKVKERRGLRIKSFENMRELKRWIPRIGRLYNDTFVDNWEYCPLTEAEIKVVGERLTSIAHPRLIKLVIKGDEIIGFVFGFIDISAAIQRTGGRIWPFGWVQLAREFKRTQWVNFNGTGLLPGHQGVGANAILYTEMAKSFAEFNFKHADVVQVEEKNLKSQGDMKAIGVEWYKRHRIFRCTL